MEEQRQHELLVTKPPVAQTPSGSPWHSTISGFLIAAALVFAGCGWYTVYNNSSDSRIVGGDAYNFIIYATRGTALVCVGMLCAVLSVTFVVFAQMAKKD